MKANLLIFGASITDAVLDTIPSTFFTDMWLMLLLLCFPSWQKLQTFQFGKRSASGGCGLKAYAEAKGQMGVRWCRTYRFYILWYEPFETQCRSRHADRLLQRSNPTRCWYPWSTFSWDTDCTGQANSAAAPAARSAPRASVLNFYHLRAWASS